MIDVEATLVAALKASAVNTATEGRISTELPASFRAGGFDEDRVHVFMVANGPLMSHIDHAMATQVQLDCWGETKHSALQLAFLVRDELRKIEGETLSGVVVNSLDHLSGPTWLPDDETDSPRYLLTYSIATHLS